MNLDKIKKLLSKETTKSIGYVTLGKALSVIFGFATIFLSARGLEVNEYGKLALYLSIVELVNLVTLPGFNSILLKAIHHKQYSFLKTAYRWTFLSSILLGTGSFSIFYFLNKRFNYISNDSFELAIFALFFVMAKTLEKSEAIFPALKEFKLLAIFNFLSSITRFLGLGLTIYFTNNLYLSIKVYISLQFILGLISIFTVFKISKKNMVQSTENSYVSESIQMSFLNFFNTGIGQLDRLLLYNLSPISLGLFQAGMSYPEKFREVIKTFIMTVTNSWLSYGNNVFIERTNKKLYFLICLVIISMITFYFAPYIYIPIIFGEKYRSAIPIASIAGIIIFIRLINYYFQTRDIVFENVNRHQFKVVVYRISYLVTLFLTINKYGVYGALSAILASEVIYLLLLTYDYYKSYKRSLDEIPTNNS